MRKLILSACIMTLGAGASLAGGYSAPAVEAEPVVIEQSSSSNPGLLIPIMLLVAIAVAASSGSDSGSPE